jgi:hypothetical protein
MPKPVTGASSAQHLLSSHSANDLARQTLEERVNAVGMRSIRLHQINLHLSSRLSLKSNLTALQTTIALVNDPTEFSAKLETLSESEQSKALTQHKAICDLLRTLDLATVALAETLFPETPIQVQLKERGLSQATDYIVRSVGPAEAEILLQVLAQLEDDCLMEFETAFQAERSTLLPICEIEDRSHNLFPTDEAKALSYFRETCRSLFPKDKKTLDRINTLIGFGIDPNSKTKIWLKDLPDEEMTWIEKVIAPLSDQQKSELSTSPNQADELNQLLTDFVLYSS